MCNRKDRLGLSWSPAPKGWIKINVNVSRRHRTRSTTIGYIMRTIDQMPLWLGTRDLEIALSL